MQYVTPSINWWCKSRDRKQAKSISVRNNRWNSQIARIFENVLVNDFHWLVYHRNVHSQNVSFRSALRQRVLYFQKIRRGFPANYPEVIPIHCTRYASGKIFLLWEAWKATHKRQFCHKLVIGNFNITSLTGKKHWHVKKARRFTFQVDDTLSTKRCGTFPVELDHG